MSNQSLADTFIAVMSDLRRIEPEGDDPMRYATRSLRSEAEQIIGTALRHAQQLAYIARQLSKDSSDAVKEAVKAAEKNED